MLHNIFDYPIYVKEVEDLGAFERHRKVFTKQIVNIATHLAKNSKDVNLAEDVEQRGESTTTVGRYKGEWLILNLPSFVFLEKILRSSVLEARDAIFGNTAGNTIELSRAWNNVNYKNSYTVSHHHNIPNKNVLACIFYLEAPANSGKFAVIDDGRINLICTDFDQTKVHYIDVKPNMLICHAGNVTHGVSEHLSDDRRTCVVLEYILT